MNWTDEAPDVLEVIAGNGLLARCLVRRRGNVVMATEQGDNPGPSVTNAAEYFAFGLFFGVELRRTPMPPRSRASELMGYPATHGVAEPLRFLTIPRTNLNRAWGYLDCMGLSETPSRFLTKPDTQRPPFRVGGLYEVFINLCERCTTQGLRRGS